jgi:hypothetical protein
MICSITLFKVACLVLSFKKFSNSLEIALEGEGFGCRSSLVISCRFFLMTIKI